MKGTERREEILRLLTNSEQPLSGAALASHFSVSRQVIVQDMALIRAEHKNIISTNRGYLLNKPASEITRIVKTLHSDEEIADELNIIVDLGGTAIDVFVRHKVYGLIKAELNISSRRDVKKFMEGIKSGKSTPLKDVTSGYHYHTLSADSEETLDLIEAELKSRGFLCERQ